MKRIVASAGMALLVVVATVAPAAAARVERSGIDAAEQANVFDGINLSGATEEFVYGSSNSNLAGISWDNRISSLKTTTVVGHGFVFWTGPNMTDSSLKICGPSTRNTMPSGFNNSISSYNSTTSCPS